MSSLACLNPNYIGEPRPRENHVPVVEVFPAPSNVPIDARFGGDCADQELRVVAMDDTDDDVLTVRWDLRRTVGDAPTLSQLQLSPPLSRGSDDKYPINDTTTLKLSRGKLAGLNIEDVQQLVELRVSDTGFVADVNGEPIVGAGGGLFFMSWVVSVAECDAVRDPCEFCPAGGQ